MIRPLRRAHRAVFAVLPIGLAALGTGAWHLRREPARMDVLPEVLRTRESHGAERLPADWNEADGLFYWATAAEVGGPLPEDAVLVGRARGGAPIPVAPDGRGTLVFGLTHGAVRLWWAGSAR